MTGVGDPESRNSVLIPHWEHFPHDADVGVRGVGNTAAEAFEQAAVAMSAVICDPACVEPRETVEIRCDSGQLDLMLVDWLNELVVEMATRNMLFGAFSVEIEDGTLTATVRGEPIDPYRHQPAAEVKGATLTELHVGKDANGAWLAQCVLDV